MLLLATVGWGVGFTWSKSAQEGVNRALALPPSAAVGPVLTLGLRYLVAGLLLLALVGRARRGWTRASVGRALTLGVLLGASVGLQHLGLGHTSEAVSAFLTSLTVVFVPLLMTVVLRKPPPRALWPAAGLATVGVWLMTGASPSTGFGPGELLGLLCAVVFSVYLIAVNALIARDDPWRMVSGQFLVLAALMLLALGWLDPTLPDQSGLWSGLWPGFWQEIAPDVWWELLLLLAFSTLLPFVLMSLFQPRVDPAHAALIYLVEPVIAAAYAYVTRGRTLTGLELAGVSLILAANGVVELRAATRAARPAPRAAPRSRRRPA